MNTASHTFREAQTRPVLQTNETWRIAAIAMLSVRFIQGFIYYGGGSRRFIFAPSKLDPTAAHWMANKFQSAMPGALFGTGHLISFMLHHFYILYAGVILFSAAELIVGLMLMAGLMTRAAALISMGFSVILMVMFGWQGATCIDEWTMAACNLAMGAALLLGGSGAYSLDNVLLKRRPQLAENRLFGWASGSMSLPLSETGFRNVALGVFALVAMFNVATYNYYRGSVVTPFHSGPVSPTTHHLTLSDAVLNIDGTLSVHVALDGGTPEAPAHVVKASITDHAGNVVAQWDAAALSQLPKADFKNDYAYNKFVPGAFGIKASMGASATLNLGVPKTASAVNAGDKLTFTDVDGKSFTVRIANSVS